METADVADSVAILKANMEFSPQVNVAGHLGIALNSWYTDNVGRSIAGLNKGLEKLQPTLILVDNIHDTTC